MIHGHSVKTESLCGELMPATDRDTSSVINNNATSCWQRDRETQLILGATHWDVADSSQTNNLTIGWQKLNLLSHPNATLAPQVRQARASGENLNYATLAPQARQERASGENLNYLLRHYSDILVISLMWSTCLQMKTFLQTNIVEECECVRAGRGWYARSSHSS